MSAAIRRDSIAAINTDLAAVSGARVVLDRRDSQLRFAFHMCLSAIEHICKFFHRDLPPRQEQSPSIVLHDDPLMTSR
jgi:hypothetical protein